MSYNTDNQYLDVENFDNIPNGYTGVAMGKKIIDWYFDGMGERGTEEEKVTFVNGIRESVSTIESEYYYYGNEHDYRKKINPSSLHHKIKKVPYVNGKVNGIVEEIEHVTDLDSRNKSEYRTQLTYKNDKLLLCKKYKNGKLVQKIPYKDSQIDGTGMQRSVNGDTFEIVSYHNGKSENRIRVTTWDDNHKSVRIQKGEGIEEYHLYYSSQGNLRQETLYFHDSNTHEYKDIYTKLYDEQTEREKNNESIALRIIKSVEKIQKMLQETDRIKQGMDKSTPIKQVDANAPFNVVATKTSKTSER